jgi:alpha-galactosidase
VESNHAGFFGTGFVNSANQPGPYVEWSATGTGGATTLAIRHANGSTAARTAELRVNGTVVQTLSFPSTGAWSSWGTVSVTANLNAGANTVRVTATGAAGNPNLDRLSVG